MLQISEGFSFLKIFCLVSFASTAYAKVSVVATTSDIAALVTEVAADKVNLFSIGKGSQDPHQIEAKPSFMVKMRQTDLVLAQGLELESAWLTPLIEGSRNPKLQDKKNVVELGRVLDPLEVRLDAASRAEGDVHPAGNPHFQLDPERMGRAALIVASELGARDPSQKAFYEKRAKDFHAEMSKKIVNWQRRVINSGVREIVTFHKTFAYFCSRFNIKCSVQLEPKPGIPPTAAHILSVIEHIKKENVKLVLIENYFEDSVKEKLQASVQDLKVARAAVSVGGDTESSSYRDLIENLVRTIESVRP